MELINWVTSHWLEILAIIGAFDVILGIVVTWTKWDWDNNAYAILHGWIAKLRKK